MKRFNTNDLVRLPYSKTPTRLWRVVAPVNGHALDVTKHESGYVEISTVPMMTAELVRSFASTNCSF